MYYEIISSLSLSRELLHEYSYVNMVHVLKVTNLMARLDVD